MFFTAMTDPDTSQDILAQNESVIGRFAPTPSGYLHIGNIFSFLIAYLVARQAGGIMKMRMEDLDPQRSKQHFIDEIFRDFDWFGFEWVGDVVYQSHRTEAYLEAFSRLEEKALVYPCFCTRADLHAASAPHSGQDFVYSQTCKYLSPDEQQQRAKKKSPSMRIAVPNTQIVFDDCFQMTQSFDLQAEVGDFVVRRADCVFAYQLAVVVDDAAMHVTSVVRGLDLLPSCAKQILLQKCLGFSQPDYGHVPLLYDREGVRLAKRDKSLSIASLREKGTISAQDILGHLAYTAGLVADLQPCSLDELVREADLSSLSKKRVIKTTV